jgi:hypothetical protein
VQPSGTLTPRKGIRGPSCAPRCGPRRLRFLLLMLTLMCGTCEYLFSEWVEKEGLRSGDLTPAGAFDALWDAIGADRSRGRCVLAMEPA